MARKRVDWVQNPDMYTPLSTQVNNDDTVLGGVLVHSKQIQLDTIGQVALPVSLQAAAFPNRADRQVVRAVRGQYWIQPVETWTSGSVREVAVRIGKFKENPEDGVIVLNSPGYTMLGDITPGQGAYVHADQRFLWERRTMMYFNVNQTDSTRPIWEINVHWSGYEVLENDECIGVLIQNANVSNWGSTGEIRFMTYLRALCEVRAR